MSRMRSGTGVLNFSIGAGLLLGMVILVVTIALCTLWTAWLLSAYLVAGFAARVAVTIGIIGLLAIPAQGE